MERDEEMKDVHNRLDEDEIINGPKIVTILVSILA
jgi:hypothetical protein